MKHAALLALIGAAGLATPVLAQTNFYLVNQQSLDVLSGADTTTYWIGNNPAGVAFDGQRLYVSGYNSGGSRLDNNGVSFSVAIVAIDNVLAGPGERQFISIAPSRTAAVTGADAISALDYQAGVGLVANYDIRGLAGGKIRFWPQAVLNNVTAGNIGGDFFALPINISRGGIAGPAFDFGVGTEAAPAAGVDYLPDGAPDGVPDGPLVVGLDNGTQTAQATFPVPGSDPDALQYFYSSAVGGAPLLGTAPLIEPNSGNGTIWRDIDIHPRTGVIAARADNELVIAPRSNLGTVIEVDSPGSPAFYRERVAPPQVPGYAAPGPVSSNNNPFGVGFNCTILHGRTGGDVVIWNNRPAGAAANIPFSNAFVVTTLGASPVQSSVPTFLNANGSALELPIGNGYYNFSWHEPSQTLVISDFQNRNVYFFTTTAPVVACNIADIVSIGGFPPPDNALTVDDYTSFINAFAGDDLLADIVSIGGFPPADGELTVDDYTSFINAFAEGCPG